MKKSVFVILCFVFLISCGGNKKKNSVQIAEKIQIPEGVFEYGYSLNDYKVIKDTIRQGESFGIILDRHHIFYPKINKIARTVKDTFNMQ